MGCLVVLVVCAVRVVVGARCVCIVVVVVGDAIVLGVV